MNIATREVDKVRVFDLEGRLDTQTSNSALEKLLESLAERPPNVLVNFATLEFISSAGLRVVLRIAKEVRGYGGAFRVCEARGIVKEVMDVSGFDSLLDLYGEETEALLSF